MGLCDRNKREICAKKEKSVSIVKERERRGVRIHIRTIKSILDP